MSQRISAPGGETDMHLLAILRQSAEMALWEEAQDSEREKQAERIQRTIEGMGHKIGMKDFTIECFGSFSNGFKTGTSDVDVVLLTEDAENPVRYLQQFAAMAPQMGFTNVTKIFSANVPLIKISDQSGIEVDFCINNRLGARNSALLLRYCQYDKRVEQLGKLVKQWAKKHELVGTADGCLNSYCYMLLVIYYLQAIEPAVAPNLQMLEEKPNIVKDTKWGTVDQWDTRFLDDISGLPRSTNTQNVEMLLIGFLNFYGYDFDWSRHAVCMRLARPGERVDKFKLMTPTYEDQWYVEDPFDLKHNLAGKCTKAGKKRMIGSMQDAWMLLTTTGEWGQVCPLKEPDTFYLKTRVSAGVSPQAMLEEFEEYNLCRLYFPKADKGSRGGQAFLEFTDPLDRRKAHSRNENYVADCQLLLHYSTAQGLADALATYNLSTYDMASYKMQRQILAAQTPEGKAELLAKQQQKSAGGSSGGTPTGSGNQAASTLEQPVSGSGAVTTSTFDVNAAAFYPSSGGVNSMGAGQVATGGLQSGVVGQGMMVQGYGGDEVHVVANSQQQQPQPMMMSFGTEMQPGMMLSGVQAPDVTSLTAGSSGVGMMMPTPGMAPPGMGPPGMAQQGPAQQQVMAQHLLMAQQAMVQQGIPVPPALDGLTPLAPGAAAAVGSSGLPGTAGAPGMPGGLPNISPALLASMFPPPGGALGKGGGPGAAAGAAMLAQFATIQQQAAAMKGQPPPAGGGISGNPPGMPGTANFEQYRQLFEQALQQQALSQGLSFLLRQPPGGEAWPPGAKEGGGPRPPGWPWAPPGTEAFPKQQPAMLLHQKAQGPVPPPQPVARQQQQQAQQQQQPRQQQQQQQQQQQAGTMPAAVRGRNRPPTPPQTRPPNPQAMNHGRPDNLEEAQMRAAGVHGVGLAKAVNAPKTKAAQKAAAKAKTAVIRSQPPEPLPHLEHALELLIGEPLGASPGFLASATGAKASYLPSQGRFFDLRDAVLTLGRMVRDRKSRQAPFPQQVNEFPVDLRPQEGQLQLQVRLPTTTDEARWTKPLMEPSQLAALKRLSARSVPKS